MTTRDFIAKTYNTTNDKWHERYGTERWCSSVMTDKHGTVYSYGYHYPLAMHIKGLDFINTSGYSSTTAKHINWAWQAVGNQAIGVKLYRDDAQALKWATTEDEKLGIIKRALERERDSLRTILASKKRTDTQVYRYLQDEVARVTDYLREVEAV